MSNTGLEFSWSFSAAMEFEACPRRRYWARYAAPLGRGAEAPTLYRRARQLNRLQSLAACLGTAVDRAVTGWIAAGRRGETLVYEEGYGRAAAHLNQVWRASKSGAWRDSPSGRDAGLCEHYYGRWDPAAEQAAVAEGKRRVEACLRDFLARVWPGLAAVPAAAEVPVAAMGSGRGPLEQFMYQGLRIYAIPDYVYRGGGEVVIVDWKSGGPRPEEHARQLGVYGLWARHRPDLAELPARGVLEYLAHGKQIAVPLGADVLAGIEAWIEESVAGMAAYLEEGDWRRNRPVPREEWDLAADPDVCGGCRFYELCRPELERNA
ncbi:MAG: PD-(D/E)XK nuclease family protein [Candidatus Marinimicrobia bacterium]|nr:PD-(D/E)XK nuclease family protein [Candidatus Neomarinimicrobiota bacterium]